MMKLLTYYKWKDFAIEIYCSNIYCKNVITIDSREITGIVYCTQKCQATENYK